MENKKNTQHKNIQSREEYLNSAHRLGRLGAILSVLVMLALPTVMAFAYNAFPSVKQVLLASVGLLAIFAPVAIGEVVSYTPILGSSIYLTLLTGNVMNLKIPVVTNVLKQLDIPSGSEDADVISGISVAVSSITTVVIIALGVLLMVPLRPVLTLPAVATATNYVLPALFGAMALGVISKDLGGGVRTKNRLLGAVPACVAVTALYLVSPVLVEVFKGILIVAMLPVTYLFTRYLYKRNIVQVFLPGEDVKSGKEVE